SLRWTPATRLNDTRVGGGLPARALDVYCNQTSRCSRRYTRAKVGLREATRRKCGTCGAGLTDTCAAATRTNPVLRARSRMTLPKVSSLSASQPLVPGASDYAYWA